LVWHYKKALDDILLMQFKEVLYFFEFNLQQVDDGWQCAAKIGSKQFAI
jgi:hypothetical protein